MLKHIVFSALALAGSALAQSPLSTLTGGTNQGNLGGGIYFDLQINSTVTITQIDIRNGAAAGQGTGQGVVEIWLGPTTYLNNVTNPSLWALVGTGTAANCAPSSVANFVLSTPFALGPGNYGVALKSQATASGGNVAWGFGYTNGGGCTSNTIPGSCTNPASLFATAEMTLRAGAAQNAFLSGGVFTPRIFNGAIHYTPGGTPIAVAAWENYGDGCNKFRTSFHEFFPNPASVDVQNSTLTMNFLGNAYAVAAGGTAFTTPSPTAPVGAFASGNATVLATALLGGPLPFALLYPSGGSVAIASDLEINADGFISPVPLANTWSAPSPTAFNTGAARWAPHWKNMNVTAGGTITCEIEAGTGALVVSWNGVNDNGGTTTMQVAFLPNGNVEYRYGAISVGGGGSFPALIGWTGGASLDNPVDVSAGGFQTSPTDNAELKHNLSGRPRLGTSVNLVTTDVPAGSAFGVEMASFVQFNPGVPLAAFGAPGCFQYQGAEISLINFAIANNSFQQAFPIPSNTALNGALFYGQSASFSPGQNPLGVVFSNGTRMVIGGL